MPHLVILYTPNLDRAPDAGGVDMSALCRDLADTMIAQRDEHGGAVFPVGGVRVLAYPATHFALADGGAADQRSGGDGDYAFVYLNLRMARGRSSATHASVGAALQACVKTRFAATLAARPLGVTLQIDEGEEVFDAKNSSLHPLFKKA